MTSRQLFVTTALPYANGPFHIGHIMEYIQADIWVRFMRMQGHTVHFVGADDAHGAPIMIAAQKKGVTPQDFVATISAGREPYLQGFNIAFDHWHHTDSAENHELAATIYLDLKRNGLIRTRTVEQFFDPEQGLFLPDRFIKGECPRCHAKDQYGDNCEVCGAVYAPTDLIAPYSALSGVTPVLRESEHYFFTLSDPRCVAFLTEWTASGAVQAEVLNKIREWLIPTEAVDAQQAAEQSQLGDWDISRDAPYFGIPIPDAPGKYFYVWLDAPIGYLATLKHYFKQIDQDFDAFMNDPATEQIHFIGKDIITFHTLFWPAMLYFSGRKTPTKICVHGFLTVSGEKMSKSRGTGLDPLRYLQLGMNPDWLRYYLAAKLNGRNEDVDFNPDDFCARINADLVGKFVNIAARSAGFLSQRFAGQVLAMTDSPLLQSLRLAQAEIATAYESRDYARAIRLIMQQADAVNAYTDEMKPWVLAKDPAQTLQLHQACSTLIQAFALLARYLAPVLPAVSRQIETLCNVNLTDWRTPLCVTVIEPYQHLLQRVDPKQLDALFA